MQREENASPVLISADTRVDYRVEEEELPLPPGHAGPATLPTLPSVDSPPDDSNGLRSEASQGLSLEAEYCDAAVHEEELNFPERLSALHEIIENALKAVSGLTWIGPVGEALRQEIMGFPPVSASGAASSPFVGGSRSSQCSLAGRKIRDQKTFETKLMQLEKSADVLSCISERFVSVIEEATPCDLMISESQYWFLIDTVDKNYDFEKL